VPHDRDWTYSLAFPPGHEWHSLKAEESYRRVHEWIRSAFAELKIRTELAVASRRSSLVTRHSSHPSACFVGHVKSDLLWNGRKIAGAAQRRNQLGLLIQGSVQPPLPLERTAWQQAMRDAARTAFGVEWLDFEPDRPLRERAETLARQKYSQGEFITRR